MKEARAIPDRVVDRLALRRVDTETGARQRSHVGRHDHPGVPVDTHQLLQPALCTTTTTTVRVLRPARRSVPNGYKRIYSPKITKIGLNN